MRHETPPPQRALCADSSDEEGAHLPGKHQRPAKTVEDEPSPEKKKGKVPLPPSFDVVKQTTIMEEMKLRTL